MAREDSLIQRIRLVIDPAAKQKAVADAKKAGQEIATSVTGTPTQAKANAEKFAASFLKGMNERFRRGQAEIREAVARGLMTPEQAAAQGRANAEAYNRAVLSQIERMGNRGQLEGAAGGAAFTRLAGSLKEVQQEAPKAAGLMARLREPLGAVAFQAAGANGALGALGSHLGMFAMGAGPMVAVLAGVAALGFAWERVTAKTRAAKEATEEALARLAGLRAAETPERDVAMAIGAGQRREQQLSGEIARLERSVARNGGLTSGGNLAGGMVESNAARRLREARAELGQLRQEIAAGQRELQRLLDGRTGGSTTGGGSGGSGRAPSGGVGSSRADARSAFRALSADIRFSDRADAARAASGITGTFAGGNADAQLAATLFGAPSAESIMDSVRRGLGTLDADFARFVRDNPFRQMQEAFTQGFAGALADGIGAGFLGLFEAGNIGDGFKALTGALLSGIGGAMMEFGKASLMASTFMKSIKSALESFNPAAAIVASLGLIAGGAALMQLGKAASNSFGRMGSAGYPGGASSAGPGIAMSERGGGMTIYVDSMDPSNPVHVEVMGRMVNAADSRGLVKVIPRSAPGSTSRRSR